MSQLTFDLPSGASDEEETGGASSCPNCQSLQAQLDALEAEVNRKTREREERIKRVIAAFKKLHREHPEIWDAFVRLAKRKRDGGREHYGIRKLWEDLRFDTHLTTFLEGVPKLSNDISYIYARMLKEKHPDLAALFEFKPCLFDGYRPWAEMEAEDASV